MRARSWLTLVAALTSVLTAGVAGTAAASPVTASVAVSYTVCGTTSWLAGAGTDSKVEIQLIGTSGSSPFIRLDNPNRDDFEIGHTDCFPVIVLRDAGRVDIIQIRFTVLSGDENHEWNLSHFTVSTGGARLRYPCQCWLVSTGTTLLRHT